MQRIIPENIKEFWRNYRAALKAAEKESMGDNDLSDDVEMVGWGVEEAQQKNKEEASEFGPYPYFHPSNTFVKRYPR